MSGAHPWRDAFADSGRSLLAFSTLLAIALSFAIASGLNHASSPNLSGPIFGAIATLVALIVPTAALANGYLEGRMLDYLAKILTGGGDQDMVDVGASVDRHAKAVVASVRPLLRGFALLLVSFAFSVGALFNSTHPIWPSGPGWLRVPVSDLCAGGALGFVFVGVMLLFPFAWSLLDRQLAENTYGLIHWQAEQYRVDNEAARVKAREAEAEQFAREGATDEVATGACDVASPEDGSSEPTS